MGTAQPLASDRDALRSRATCEYKTSMRDPDEAEGTRRILAGIAVRARAKGCERAPDAALRPLYDRRMHAPARFVRLALPAIVAVVAALGAHAPDASARTAEVTPPPGSLVPADAIVGGRSVTEWERAWLRWRLALPVAAAPSDDECITVQQVAPVWFLDGDGAQPSAVTRRCKVPGGRYLLFGPWIMCSTVGPFRVRAGRLTSCARRQWKRNFRGLDVTVDGAELHPSGVRVATGAFRFRLPSGPDMLLAGPARRGRGAARAKVALLTPLSAGRHRIKVVERYRGLRRKVTYRITVS
jgi:hypothetical protein